MPRALVFFFRSNDRPLIAQALVCAVCLSAVDVLSYLGFVKFDRIFLETYIAECTKCLGPYHVESTSSRPITEVKQHRAALVLGWVTAWEYAVP